MGGMEGFGPVRAEPESQEPVFHAQWEGRVYGINLAAGFHRLWNIDMSRHARERQQPAVYLKNSYYENWLEGIQTLLLEAGVVTQEEIRTGKSAGPAPKENSARTLRREQIGKTPLRLTDYRREVDNPPKFRIGDRVLAINRHPTGHTRQPRYVRGHVGTVYEHYGAQVFPDLSAQGIDEGRHLYNI